MMLVNAVVGGLVAVVGIGTGAHYMLDDQTATSPGDAPARVDARSVVRMVFQDERSEEQQRLDAALCALMQNTNPEPQLPSMPVVRALYGVSGELPTPAEVRAVQRADTAIFVAWEQHHEDWQFEQAIDNLICL